MLTAALCDFSSAKFLIISENVPPLVYYSHLPVAILSLIVGLSVLVMGWKNLASRTLFIMTATFSLWVFLDSIFWASNRSDTIMFVWALILLIEPVVHAGGIYLVYQLLEGRTPPFILQMFIGLLFLPLIVLVPTDFALSSFKTLTCLAEEGPIALYYTYFMEAIFTSIVIIYSVVKYNISKSTSEKRQATVVSFGVVVLLFAFSWGNIMGSFTENWQLGQYGLFGLPIFVTFLAYSIVKFETFNIKLVATQALAFASTFLIGSQFFFIQNNTNRVLTFITLMIFIVASIFIVKSVKREISLREELQTANEGQANLIHIINHQIKGYLAKGRNIFSELLSEPSYGPIPDTAKPMLEEGFSSLTEGVDFVTDFLIASNIEKGTFVYNMQPLDFKKLVTEVTEKQKEVAKDKGLSFDLAIADGDYNMKGDASQLGQAVKNLIDNSIKYTPSGNVKVQMTNDKGKILLKIQDTGVGISDELKPKLFTKGGRDKNSLKINVNSTGFGLSYVKGVVEAHHGRVWADSTGPNQGSTFYMELPVV